MATYPITIRLLISLDKDECIKFRDYLNSSYFNSIKTLPKLFNLILHEFKAKKNTYCKEDFMQKAYDNPNLSTYGFHLGKLKGYFEHFVVLQQIGKEERLYNQLILEDYFDRKDGCFFDLKYNRIKSRLDRLPRDIYHYQYQSKLEELLDGYLKTYKDNRVGDTNLQATSDSIDRDFILKKLCCLVLMHNRQNITKVSYNFGFKSYVLDYLKSKPVIEEPLINLFYQAYLILTDTDKKTAFENLNKQLQTNDPLIAREMVEALLLILQNNLKRITEIEAELHQLLFDLYKILLNQNYFQTNGKLPINFYRNVVFIGLELDKYDYVEQFIENYKNKLLPETLAAKVYAYNKAKFLVYTGNPLLAQELIFNLHFDDAIDKFSLKCLLIMIYYELKEDEIFTSCINNFRSNLSQNRPSYLSKENTTFYRNFINAVNKLFKFTKNPNTTKNDIQKLTDSIQKTNRISNRKWLLIKAEELIK